MTNWDVLKNRSELNAYASACANSFEVISVPKSKKDTYLQDGWEIFKEYKTKVKMKRSKPIGAAFEDVVWTLFYNMGFKIMNVGRNFDVSYLKDDPALTKQIDVVAIDDEVCLCIECKAAETFDQTKAWKTELEGINGYQEGVFQELGSRYPNRKFKYIFATQNYLVGNKDVQRMQAFHIANFDKDAILYYSELVKHLGSAAKFQLLGALFAGEAIPKLNNTVPAIKGKMGDVEYYSFLIKPIDLLKTSYILHRINANLDHMPTYQRLIKRERLLSVRKFLNDGGYFPNSLIVTNGRGYLNFIPYEDNTEALFTAGLLKLPDVYQSIYVIDGQHRLYGYSDSNKADKDVIPVVAFPNLDKSEQIKMFMDINENQKSVTKPLRNLLSIDLFWDSAIKKDSNLSLMLYIAQSLGDKRESPLYKRVVTGENTVTDFTCITTECIKDALLKTSFISKYKRNNTLDKQGTLDYGNNNQTAEILILFLMKSFAYIKDNCENEWNKNASGFITINNMTFALIKVFDDIVNIVLKEDNKFLAYDSSLDIRENATNLLNRCHKYYVSLVKAINTINDTRRNTIKTEKGAGANNKSWHTLQVILKAVDSNFTTEELEKYIAEYETDYRDEVTQYMVVLDEIILKRLGDIYTSIDNWQNDLVPQDFTTYLVGKKAVEENNRSQMGSYAPVSYWDFINYGNLKKVVAYGSNWTNFVMPLFSNVTGLRKQEFLKYISALNEVKTKLNEPERWISLKLLNEIKPIYERLYKERVE